MNYVQFFLACIGVVAVFSCKPPEVTNSPGAKTDATDKSDNGTSNGPLVKGSQDVPLQEVPRVTIEVDLADCVGAAGKWFDPANQVATRIGSVSVAPTRKDSQESGNQPPAWVFDPSKDSADGAVNAKGSQPWRLERGSYSVEVIAFNSKTAAAESKINKDFDFKESNDLTLTVVGSWVDSNCSLKWK